MCLLLLKMMGVCVYRNKQIGGETQLYHSESATGTCQHVTQQLHTYSEALCVG